MTHGSSHSPPWDWRSTSHESYAVTGYYSEEVAARPTLVIKAESVISRVLFDTSNGHMPKAMGVEILDHAIVYQSFEVNDEIPSADILRDPQVIQALMQTYQADGAGGGPLGQSNMSGLIWDPRLKLLSGDSSALIERDVPSNIKTSVRGGAQLIFSGAEPEKRAPSAPPPAIKTP
ncbi:hypothetical protein B0T14DRAFT_585247 [Immersiella caudata]|uniref:Uncharacterized protein n=1 Tax=Immersiella caudata TaxID=314043 RepID=A0AA39WQ61_9PEZI|nr:hypothetical protein B0T14DRAFT_585247 [Immersiella caudata]